MKQYSRGQLKLFTCLFLVGHGLVSFQHYQPQQKYGGFSSAQGHSSDQAGNDKFKPPTITVAIPSIREDIHVNLPRLKESMDTQTSMPDEVVLVVSGVHPDECPTFGEWKVICHLPLIHAGIARNLAWDRASSEVVSFVDADDQMYPERISVIRSYFDPRPNLQLLLHSSSTEPLQEHNKSVFNGIELEGHAIYTTAVKTRGKKIWVVDNSVPGHLTIRKSIHCAPFPAVIYEDSVFVRSCIDSLGNSSEAMAYIPHALTHYIPRRVQKARAAA